MNKMQNQPTTQLKRARKQIVINHIYEAHNLVFNYINKLFLVSGEKRFSECKRKLDIISRG